MHACVCRRRCIYLTSIKLSRPLLSHSFSVRTGLLIMRRVSPYTTGSRSGRSDAALYKDMESRLIPPSSIWYCHWPGVATWRMVVGGVSDARTNGAGEVVGRALYWLNTCSALYIRKRTFEDIVSYGKSVSWFGFPRKPNEDI
ncbi:hypothetical protein TNCV_4475091 [Trichonephila clavipes]|nr:hypothetical protein TNCV_4475091 [Trichonephila clavipes]